MASEELERGGQEFKDERFWKKVRRYAAAIGCPLLCLAFKLYYALENPNTPAWAKSVIWGALAYLISPLDAIPDVTPVVGYADDLVALTAAFALVATYVDSNAVRKADEQVKRLVASCACSDSAASA